MPKDSVKDKLDGKELDLSLNDLTVVPVKEMASLTRGTHVDLSCNLLTSLPEDFASLGHIVKLDLSKNQLTSLPENIGGLKKLQHLDLYGNRLTTFPVSFFQLKNLRWLDLRDNPLTEELKRVAGDCLNEAECKQCAKNVLAYMTTKQADLERTRQKRLQQEREVEAERKVEEEKEKQRRKAEKLVEKERRREAYQAAQAVQQQQADTETVSQADDNKPNARLNGPTSASEVKVKQSGTSCWQALFVSMLGLVVVMAIVYFYCDTHKQDALCKEVNKHLLVYWRMAKQTVEKYLKK